MAKTFVVVTLLWSVFRSPSFGDLHNLFSALIDNHGTEHLQVGAVAWVALALFVLSDLLTRHSRFDAWCGHRPAVVRWALYAVLVFAVIAQSSVQNYPFIYFQF